MDPAFSRGERVRDLFRVLFVAMMACSALGLFIGGFWIFGAYSSQYNGTAADQSNVGGLGWEMGVLPVAIVGTIYHLLLLLVGLKGFGSGGAKVTLISAGVTLLLYVALIIPGAMATGGPEQYVP